MNFFRQLRESRNMTQEALGNELGLDKSAICKWEKNESFPSRDNIIKLADFFECSIDDIVRITQSKMES